MRIICTVLVCLSSFTVETDVRVTRPQVVDLDAALVGTPLEGLGPVFTEVGERWGVHPAVLAGIVVHESAFGTSPLAQRKNNLAGLQAYDRDPYNSAATFGSFEECIEALGKHLALKYLDVAGPYYNGVTLQGIGVRYATDPKWASKVAAHVQRLIEGGGGLEEENCRFEISRVTKTIMEEERFKCLVRDSIWLRQKKEMESMSSWPVFSWGSILFLTSWRSSR